MELIAMPKTEPELDHRHDAYRKTVERIVRYLNRLPGGARQAWQEAAYQSYLADKLERDEMAGRRNSHSTPTCTEALRARFFRAGLSRRRTGSVLITYANVLGWPPGPFTPFENEAVPDEEPTNDSVNGVPTSVSPDGLRGQLAEDIASRYGQYVALLFKSAQRGEVLLHRLSAPGVQETPFGCLPRLEREDQRLRQDDATRLRKTH